MNELGLASKADVKDVAMADRAIKKLTKELKASGLHKRNSAHGAAAAPRAKDATVEVSNKELFSRLLAHREEKVIPKAVWKGFVELKTAVTKESGGELSVEVQKALDGLLSVMADRVKHPEKLEDKNLIKFMNDPALASEIMRNSLPHMEAHDPQLAAVFKAVL